ncbi:MFS transporter [Liquorilactobacillus mali]|uniref:Major facilitator superfamily permease n=1 Tax=Liquorilactobacillus mali KCTC 3596 = DSM 20444 TaxID=1046596 RepID=A0A0R2E8Z9_9LACO|nr:MFS transporter [Liquorilactobacillus mali]KRN10389.1 major facilitator superfamily permease [Liquorilactobacillus mali KCTC 3596 = DSM 20444]
MKNKAALFASMFINMGIGLIMPVTTLFIHERLNQSLVIAGYVLMFFSIAMVIGNLIGGFLLDRWKVKQTHYLGGAIVCLSLTMIIVWPLWPFYAFLVAFYGLGLGILNSAVNGYIAYLQKKDVGIFTNAYWLGNIGMGISTFLSGTLFAIGIREVFLSSLILFSLTLMIIAFNFNEIEHEKLIRTSKKFNLSENLSSLTIICLIIIIIWVGYEQWNSNISVLMLAKNISVQKYSFLFTISTFEIVIFQPLLRPFFKASFNNERLRVFVGVIMFAVSYLLIIDASTYWRFILGITALSIGDVLALTTIPALLNRYANDSNRASIQSISSTAGSAGRALGPLIGGYMISQINYNFSFIVIFISHIVLIPLILLLKNSNEYTR